MNKSRYLVLAFILFSTLFFCACDPQYRVTFDPEQLTIATCNNMVIEDIKISRVGDQSSFCNIALDKYKKGQSRVSLLHLSDGYYYLGCDQLSFKPNERYRLYLRHGHSNAKVLFSIDATGKVVEVQNLAPCR